MSETLASLRSLGRSRGGRAGACPGSAACVLVRLPTPGGGSRDLEEGGLGRRSRLRVIGWDAHEGVCQSNGGIIDARPPASSLQTTICAARARPPPIE